ncbi:MAG: hypothetical protein IT196_01360 [Acidimicrobiales bacterium]|nr:hypothetical protein [Acidimicrobiales bacterium]
MALTYAIWAPLAARSVTSPLRMIQKHTPGVGEHGDVYLDRATTQFESATVLVTLIVLVSADFAMIFSGVRAAGGRGLGLGIALAFVTLAAWMASLNDFRASPRDTLDAAWLLARGYPAPAPSSIARTARSDRNGQVPSER